MHGFADHAFADQANELGVVVIGHVLGAYLHQAARLGGHGGNFLSQFELVPVRQRLLAVDILARTEGVDRLRRVVPVGRGHTDYVDVGVFQERLVLIVHRCPATTLGGVDHPWPVDVADGHRLGDAFLLELEDDPLVVGASRPRADETDPQPFVGALARRGHRGCVRRQGHGGTRDLEKRTTVAVVVS